MPFAPEDTKVWESSEVMAEFEKVAAQMQLLDDFSEAYQPIPEKKAMPLSAWDSRATVESPKRIATPALKAFANCQAELLPALRKIARALADEGNSKGAYRTERAMAELKAIIGAPDEGGE